MWWGSHLGMWVWLMLAWSGWLGLGWLVKRLAPRLPRPAAGGSPAGGRARLSLPRLGTIAGCLAALAGTAGVGAAVASTEQPDEHQPLYRPTARLAAKLVRVIPRGSTVEMLGTLGIATMPIKPSLRYFLVRHGVRPLAPGSFLRLGDWYELFHRPYQYVVYVREGTRQPASGLRLLDRVHISDGFGRQTVSLWYGPHRPAPVPARPGAHHGPAPPGHTTPTR
jgi:hypothetical protein